MFPGREVKLTPPSWCAGSLGSSSSSSEMRDKVPVIVAGLQVFTSLNMTGERRRWGDEKKRTGKWEKNSGGIWKEGERTARMVSNSWSRDDGR